MLKMDVEAAIDVPANHDSVVREEEEEEESVVPPPVKKPRFDEEVNRVAEIVLVLSALRRIRGGKSPTELELELMVEAKSKLVEMCQEFNPKDIIGRDAIGAVIEDLGLNCKLKDQRLGFRAPKLTISEKLSLGKRKMEESKKNPIVSTSYTSPGHSTSTNNVSMAHQWHSSEMKVSSSSVNATGSHFVSGVTQPRPQFKPDMHTGASQGPVVTPGNYFGNATTWSAQTHSSSSTISFGTPSESKVPVQSSSRVADPSFRPFMSQTPPGAFPGMKGVSYGQTSTPFGNNNNNHAEIAKIIHKVLQPRAKQNLLWNPPSREYMTKTITCQMCQGAINEVETVLICDACEKGYHLKCLQANNMKGIPKSEWHCPRCVQVYNGKSFPPKYGRVMRSATTAKMSSSAGEVQLPEEKKVGKISLKVNQKAVSDSETAKPTQDTATNQIGEAKDAAMNPTIEAEDAAMNQTIEAKDAAMNSTVEAEVAATNPTVEAEDVVMSSTVEAKDAATNPTVEAEDAATNPTVEAEDAAMNPTVETNDTDMNPTVEAEDVAMNQTADANNESQNPIGNNAECGDPSGAVSQPETLNPPRIENREDPNKDVTERSVSAECQDKDSNIIAETLLQEENSASQTEDPPSQPPLQSNTDHSQQQNETQDVQEAIQKNDTTENPEEDKSCE